MENSILVGSRSFAVGDVRKEEKLGALERRKLSDISNLQERPKPTNPDPKRKSSTSITSKEYIDKILKENTELMKLLADRNKLIELSVVELRKLRANLQNLQLQNLQLAQTNSQMMGELNSGKDKLKLLQHNLACQNAVLKTRKLEERRKRVAANHKVNVHEIPSTGHKNELEKPYQEDTENEQNGNRRRQSRRLSLGCPPVKPINDYEEANNKKRRCSRRQSTRLVKSEGSESTEDSFEVEDANLLVSSQNEDPLGPTCETLVESSSKADNEPTVVSEHVNVSAIHSIKESDKKRHSRRQSARFVNYETTEDSFGNEDSSSLNRSSPRVNVVMPSAQTTPGLSVDGGNEFRNSGEVRSEESRRYSVGRPSRRAAEKIPSYKEASLKLKMRRTQ